MPKASYDDMYAVMRQLLLYGSQPYGRGGDMFWQLMGLFAVMGWDADTIAQRNLAKLRSRAERGVIDGNGDNDIVWKKM